MYKVYFKKMKIKSGLATSQTSQEPTMMPMAAQMLGQQPRKRRGTVFGYWAGSSHRSNILSGMPRGRLSR